MKTIILFITIFSCLSLYCMEERELSRAEPIEFNNQLNAQLIDAINDNDDYDVAHLLNLNANPNARDEIND